MSRKADREPRRAPAASVEEVLGVAPDDDEGGLPVGLFVLTAGLGLLVLLDVFVTRGQPLWGLPWRPAAIAAVIGGARVTIASLAGALEGQIGADLALAIATWAALAIGEPIAAAEVVFIAMTGESLEAVAFARTAKALERLLALWPRTARVWRDGEEVLVPSHEVLVGETVSVLPGERLPVDGVILAGETSLDESSLTGESVPVDKLPGDDVFSGTQNLFGAIRVRAERVGAETTLGQVVQLVKQAETRQAPVQRTADLYASYFLPVVLVCAALTFWFSRDWFRTVAVLVVACPCALVLATPAAVLAGIGRLARVGVLVKSGEALETMARVRTLAFDKTGTLTRAKLELGTVVPLTGGEDELLRLAAAAEAGSEHPLARVIVAAAAERGLTVPVVERFEARPGAGLVADWIGGRLAVGNARLMDQLGVRIPADAQRAADELAADGQTTVLVAREQELLGVLGARDRLRDDAVAAVAELHRLGLGRVALLTGDRPQVAEAVARTVGIDEVLSEQLPTDKAAWVRTRRNAGERVAMIGDGINDAPALAEADVGVAVAETGSDIAAEAADIVLLGDPLAQVPQLIDLSRQVLATIRLSIIGFAFGLNGLAVLLSAFGKLSPVQAAIFHQVGSLAVLLNSLRLLGFEPRPESLPARLTGGGRRLIEAILSLDIDGLVGWLAVRWRAGLRLAGGAALVWWLASAVVFIQPGEQAVIRVLGRHVGTWGPGVAVKPWWPLGRATKVRVEEVKAIEIGFRSAPRRGRGRSASEAPRAQYDWNSAHLTGDYTRLADEVTMLTGDENFVEVQAVVQYTVERATSYVFRADKLEEQLRAYAEEALRQVVAVRGIDEIMTTGRHAIEEATRQRAQATCERLGLGVTIEAVEMADCHPPLEVVPAFRAVSSAYETKLQRINEAEAYANETVALARGEAAAELAAARAYAVARREKARGDADRFRARQQAALAGRQVTMIRLWFEAVERSLVGRSKSILDPTVTARRQYWSLEPGLADSLRALGRAAPSAPAVNPFEEAEPEPPAPATPPAESSATASPTTPAPTLPGLAPTAPDASGGQP